MVHPPRLAAPFLQPQKVLDAAETHQGGGGAAKATSVFKNRAPTTSTRNHINATPTAESWPTAVQSPPTVPDRTLHHHPSSLPTQQPLWPEHRLAIHLDSRPASYHWPHHHYHHHHHCCCCYCCKRRLVGYCHPHPKPHPRPYTHNSQTHPRHTAPAPDAANAEDAKKNQAQLSPLSHSPHARSPSHQSHSQAPPS